MIVQNSALVWQVNGITGGNSGIGTISASGTYVAPSTAQSVIISCYQANSPSNVATLALAVTPLLISGPTQLTTGTSTTFQATIAQSSALVWQVNGITGGNSSVGTISSNGTYIAPDTPQSVTISCYETTDPSSLAAHSLAIIPVPLVISGPNQLTAGSSTTFQTTFIQNSPPIWQVNSITGGNSSIGTITSNGTYVAPNAAQSVTISCYETTDPPNVATQTLTISSVPLEITSGDAIPTESGTLFVDILGSGFSVDATVLVNGSPIPTTWLSSSQLQAQLSTVSIEGSVFTAAVTEQAPNSAVSNSITISVSSQWQSSIPLPIGPDEMPGCVNPNSGVSASDFGAWQANYVTDPDPVLNAPPTYAQNTIFWVSRETGPGESILMTGAFTGAQKSAKLALIPAGTTDWQSVVQASGTPVTATQIGNSSLTVLVPPSFPSRVYGFEVDDPTTMPIFSLANEPTISWTIGVPKTSDLSGALQHGVHDCGAEPGQGLRLFGKNFNPSDDLILMSAAGDTYKVAPKEADANSISATLPDTLPVGTYSFWVGNSSWDATSSSPMILTIAKPPALSAQNVQCANLTGDGKTDNAAQLQECLDQSAPSAASNLISRISIPAGSFCLSTGLHIHSFEILVGDSPSTTQLLGCPQSTVPNSWITVDKSVGLANFAFSGPVDPYILTSSDTTGNPTTSGSLFVDNIDFEMASDLFNGNQVIFNVAGPDLQIYNSKFRTVTQGSGQSNEMPLSLNFGDGAIVSGDTFVDTNSTTGIGNSQNIVFEKNNSFSEEGPGDHGGMGLTISRSFSTWALSSVIRNIYVGHNFFHDIGWPGQGAIETDGGAGAYYGYVAESTNDTVTLSEEPSWVWTGNSDPSTIAIEIVSGTGAGQYSLLKSINDKVIGLITPWKVLPDSTSIVQVISPKTNLTLAHNKFKDTTGPSFLLFGGGVDSLVEDNQLIDSGSGLQLWAYGPYGTDTNYFSNLNTEVFRNSISDGSGEWITNSTNQNTGGIDIGDMPGCVVSGMLVRGNVVPSDQTIADTLGVHGIIGNLIEDNIAIPVGFSYPGFLVQNNQNPQAPQL